MQTVANPTLPAVRTIVPSRHNDNRGFFSEVWREDALRSAGIVAHFVQENHTFSRAAGTVRGLHFQIGAAAQAKLVRCVRGAIFDVAVDIRHGSPTFGSHVAHVLSAENWQQVFVPAGFAHGYCTLEPATEVMYKATSYYDPAADKGLAWDDPALRIAWPMDRDQVNLSDRDRSQPRLADLPHYFPFASYPD